MSSTSSERILRIPRSDEADTYILAQVTRLNAEETLDLKLVATEGENIFAGSGMYIQSIYIHHDKNNIYI